MLYPSDVQDTAAAERSAGFLLTGEIDDGEVVMSLPVDITSHQESPP